MIRKIREDYVALYIVDDETGEILTEIPDTRKKKKVTNFDKYIGIDTRLPVDCKTADQLIETLSVMDGYIKDKHRVNDTFIIENVIAGNLTLQQQVFLRTLAQQVCGWNYYFGTVQHLCTMGVDLKGLWRTIRALEEKRFIKLLRKDDPYKGDVCITLNPTLIWKGDNQYREAHKMSWYGVKVSQ